MTLSSEAKLNFLRDYMVRARFDVMQDKATLTQLFYAKLIVVGGALSLISTSAGALALTLLPFVIMSLDYMHKKRFLEIFMRWEHSADQCIKAIRELDEFLPSEQFEFFEERVVARKGELTAEEGSNRLFLTLTTFSLSAPAFALVVHRFAGVPLEWGILLMWTWALFIFIVFWASFINSDKFSDTYPNKSWSVPIGLGMVVGIFSLLALRGFNILDPLNRLLPE